ncbi:MFS general substrate transporter [Macroventuria anomochaeta]|uniref:MFS general substrate transporter n=1 Tax=Macroventuria anomochaeta TaxID=301207 RepID=A0ACB6RRX8_9PLEO|nr:MFS general substrate transporter [Macroventuria anomochaeta]KAF2623677.1 MFS general substrate transporter [Macroventuria anomochaeta]
MCVAPWWCRNTVNAIVGKHLQPSSRPWSRLQCAVRGGFPSTYGVFQEYYTSNDFAGSSNLAIVGACAMDIRYMDITVWFMVLKCYPRLRPWATPVGLVVIVSHLILTQGIIYTLGGGLAWTPILFHTEEWWARRRGFAYGITMAGLGLSGAILPVILEWLLQSCGFCTMLRICALSFVVLNFPILLLFKPRLPQSHVNLPFKFDMSFWTHSKFLTLQSCNIVQGIGYFLPAIYLPTFARSLGASTIESTVTIIPLNAAASVGSLTVGVAVEKYDVVNCLLVAAIGSATGIFILWGFSTSRAPLYIFSIVYGAFPGCQASSWSGIIRDTKDKHISADSGMIFAFLSAGKGVGNLASGPLSEALLHAENFRVGFAYGSGYGALIAFTGATALLSRWSYRVKCLSCFL